MGPSHVSTDPTAVTTAFAHVLYLLCHLISLIR